MNVVPEFRRNAEIGEVRYDPDTLDSTRILIIGDNQTSQSLVDQLLVFGFKDIYLWGKSEDANAASTLRNAAHVSPYYRHAEGYASLEARAMTTSFDELGFRQLERIEPTVVVNTENNEYIGDRLLAHFLQQTNGQYFEAHSVCDHKNRMYGMRVEAVPLSPDNPLFDEHSYIDSRSLGSFDNKNHDSLMSIVSASYAASLIAKYTLNPGIYFQQPLQFTLFPFADNPLEEGPAKKQITYDGFFGDDGIYIAGLGGGSLVLDTVLKVFNAKNVWAVDYDKLERTNLNRLIPFIDESLIGRKKTEAAQKVYQELINDPERNIRIVDGVIRDDFLIGVEEDTIKIILSTLSGFENKLNAIALSQRLAERNPHILLDIGVDPFRFDITPYVAGETPCDSCRNLEDLAITEYFEQNLPGCDRFPVGSTVFSNYLGILSLVEAMKYSDPELGQITTGSITGELNAPVHQPELLYQQKEAVEDPADCGTHKTTRPFRINPKKFRTEEGFDQGWNTINVIEKESGRLVGQFRYTPKK